MTLEPRAARLVAYGRQVQLPLDAIRVVTPGAGLVLHLVDGSRFALPASTLGLERLSPSRR